MFTFFVRLARNAAMNAAASEILPKTLRYVLRILFLVLITAASGFCLFLAWSMRENMVAALLIAALGVIGLARLVRFVRRILHNEA